MPTSAIEQAHDERRRSREALGHAQEAILRAMPDTGGLPVGDLLRDVREETGLPVPVIQRALWTLVREGTLHLSEEFEPEKPDGEQTQEGHAAT